MKGKTYESWKNYLQTPHDSCNKIGREQGLMKGIQGHLYVDGGSRDDNTIWRIHTLTTPLKMPRISLKPLGKRSLAWQVSHSSNNWPLSGGSDFRQAAFHSRLRPYCIETSNGPDMTTCVQDPSLDSRLFSISSADNRNVFCNFYVVVQSINMAAFWLRVSAPIACFSTVKQLIITLVRIVCRQVIPSCWTMD